MAYSDDNPFAPGDDGAPIATLDLDALGKPKKKYDPKNPFAPAAAPSDDEIKSIEAEARGERPALPVRVPRPQPAPDLARAPRDVTATPASPQSVPNLPDDAQALRADLFRQTPFGAVDAAIPALAAGVAQFPVDVVRHPIQTAEQAVTAIPRAVTAAFRTGEALSQRVHDTGAEAPELGKSAEELLGAGMDVAALAIPGAEGVAAIGDKVAANAAQRALFDKVLESAKARGSFAAEGKALWGREQGMRDATDAAYEEYKGTHPMQGLLPPGHYEAGPATFVSRGTPETDVSRLLPSRAVGAGVPTEGPAVTAPFGMPAAPEPITDPSRLLSARAVGSGVPTEGPRQGPGIPSPDSFAAALERASAEHLAATPEEITAYRGLRDAGLGVPARPLLGESLDRYAIRTKDRPALLERNAIAAEELSPQLRGMGGQAKRNLTKIADADLESEHARLSELQSNEQGEIQAMQDNPAFMTTHEMGPDMKEDRRGALQEGELEGRTSALGMQQGRVTQRQKLIDRLSAEIERRRTERGVEEDPTDFNFGGNRRGFSAAGPLAMIAGTGVGAAVGAAAAPEGKRGEGAAAGAMAGLALSAGGVRIAREAELHPEGVVRAAPAAEAPVREIRFAEREREMRAAERRQDPVGRGGGGDRRRTGAVGDVAETDDLPHKFSSTQLNLPKETSAKISELAATIPDEDLAAAGREDQPHVTVKFGLHGNDPEAVRALLADEAPITVKMGKTSVFKDVEGGTADAVKVDVDSPALHALNEKIAAALPNSDEHPSYIPHATVAYVKPGLGAKYEGLDALDGHETTIDHVTFSGRDGKQIELPLGRAGEQLSPRRRTGALGDVKSLEQQTPDPELERIRAKAKGGGELTDKERSYVRLQRAKPKPVDETKPAVRAPGAAATGSRMAPRTPEERASMERKAELGARAQRGSETPTPRAVADAVEAAYSPATRSAQASTAAAGWRQRRGEMDHDLAVAQHGLESIADGLERESVPNKRAFMAAIESGAKQPIAKYQPVADAIRKQLDGERDRIRALGTGKLDSYLENYFPHLWQDPTKAKGLLGAITGKRPLRGSMAWEKQRKIPTIEEGIKAGLVPVSYNPIELTMLKLRDMRKYRMATEVVTDLEQRGLITQALTNKDKIPEGYAALTHDPSFRNRYAPEPVARVLNNALSPGLRGNAAYDAYMAVGNTLNRAQLGLSAFHAGMTTIEQMVSQNALAVSHLFSGSPAEALKKFVTFPVAPLTQFAKGAKLARAYLADPATLDPAMRAMVDQVTAAGGRFKSAFADEESKAFRTALDAKQYGKAATHLLPAVLEKATAPIMEHLVPRQKFGVFYDLAEREIERLGDGAEPDAVRAAVQRAWDSVDNRLGQVVYDNLFWNKATKDLLHASVRSVGWNWGTFRELGGGAKDVGAFVKDLVTPGRNAELSTRAQYAIALPITVGLLGALTQYLYTGKGPETLFDYFHPQTGTLDADGNPNRVVLPTYMKDVFAYGRDFQEGKPLRTLGNKLNPLLSMVAGMLRNRDFYDNEIRNPDDPFYKKLQQLGKYAEKEALPFSVQNLTESGKRGASTSEKGLAFVGVTPANRSAVRTPAQNKIAEYRDLEHRTETPEQVDASDAKGKAVAALKAGDAGPLAALERRGAVTRAQVKAAEKNVGANRLATSFRSLTLDQMEHVFALATPAEKAIWQGIIDRKRRKSPTPQEP